ncbi:hypothetical protein AVEN_204626-1 [Araneus ventricosus]|uniref:STPR domain-containing protein n=1 Tax=Araneus ventricosus TaxID=182803 RepID=A0A4Y2UXT0_ARAVE|nr:hypothetical protein AVEN_204626-1 [Araneus ventricosus]
MDTDVDNKFSDDDEVAYEANVRLTKTLSEVLNLFIYPIRHSGNISQDSTCLSARIKPKQQRLIFGSYYFCFVQFSLFPMLKRKRGITGDAASRREAIRKRERRVVETEEERSRRLSTMAQRDQDIRAKEAEEQRNSRLSDMAQCSQQRRAEETEEQRNIRLAVMAQRGQERRAEETEEQRNSRLAVMAQRGQRRRAEETDEQRNSRLAKMAQRGQER